MKWSNFTEKALGFKKISLRLATKFSLSWDKQLSDFESERNKLTQTLEIKHRTDIEALKN